MRKIFDQLESFNPELPLTLLFDYVRIRFPTTDARKIIQEILHLKFDYMLTKITPFTPIKNNMLWEILW